MKFFQVSITALLFNGALASVEDENKSCVTGSGSFVFRDTMEAYFKVDVCAQDDTGVAKGNLVSGSHEYDIGEDNFVYRAHCMHVDEEDGTVYLGTELQAMAVHQEVVQQTSRHLKLSGLGGMLYDILCFPIWYFIQPQEPAMGRRASEWMLPNIHICSNEEDYYRYIQPEAYRESPDLYDEQGIRRDLQASSSCDMDEGPKGTLALFSMKKDAIGVKLHHDFDITCDGFEEAVKAAYFSEDEMDDLIDGSVDFE